MEWTVSCGKDSATAKRDLAALKITYLPLGPEAEKSRQIFKYLLFGSLWLAKRSQVHDIAIVLV